MKLSIAPIAVLALLAGCGEAPAARQAEAASEAADDLPVMGPEVRVLAFGDSLLAGYGLNDGEGYPARLEAALRARGINAQITNAGVSGDTTAGGLQRLDFALSGMKEPPALAIISLGGNDMLRALPPEQTRQNLDAILTTLTERKVKVVLLGMLSPPNLGADYRKQFEPIYPALAKKYGAMLVPFFLDGVIDKPDLMQADHLHPTAQGVEEIVKRTSATVTGALPSR